MIPNFRSYYGTTNRWLAQRFNVYYKILTDPVTGAPAGIQSQNGNGPDGIWAPTQLTAAQIISPSADMIADLWAKYQLSVAPYTLYRSNGTYLTPIGASDDGTTFPGSVTQTVPAGSVLTIGAGSYAVVYAAMHIQGTLHVQGRLDVINRP